MIRLAASSSAGGGILTRSGAIAVHSISDRDELLTHDGGYVRPTSVSYLFKRGVIANWLSIEQNAFPGQSGRLIVSADVSVRISDWRAQLFFGEDETIQQAGSLIDAETIIPYVGTVDYEVLIEMPAHRLLNLNGVWIGAALHGTEGVALDATRSAPLIERLHTCSQNWVN